MDIKSKIEKLNSPNFISRREKQLKYMLYAKMGLSPESLKINITSRINITPTINFKSMGIESEEKELFSDVWNIDIYLKFEVQTEYDLSEIAFQLKEIEKNLEGFFRNVKINQFYDILENKDGWGSGLIGISDLSLSNDGILKLELWVDYETEGVDGADF